MLGGMKRAASSSRPLPSARAVWMGNMAAFQMAQACPPPPYPSPRSPAPARDAGGPDAAERLHDGGIGPQVAGEALRPDVWRRAVHSTARRYIYARTLTYYICIHI